MPTYEYRCKSCGYEFEEFQSMSDDKLVICPKCAEPSLKRLMSSGAGLLFKGNGFYLTDYKKSNTSTSSAGSGQKTESKAASKSDAKTGSGSESKPAEKAHPKTESKPSTGSSSGADKK
ncbi:MAG: zinc ribbon domain-containing protein [Bacteroidetes bacterium]|nr:zinc ribbon domain-containing protein [Bacteroidota bacterium]